MTLGTPGAVVVGVVVVVGWLWGAGSVATGVVAGVVVDSAGVLAAVNRATSSGLFPVVSKPLFSSSFRKSKTFMPEMALGSRLAI